MINNTMLFLSLLLLTIVIIGVAFFYEDSSTETGLEGFKQAVELCGENNVALREQQVFGHTRLGEMTYKCINE